MFGQWRVMACAENYVMARRQGCGAKAIHVDAWLKLSTDPAVAVHDTFRKAKR